VKAPLGADEFEGIELGETVVKVDGPAADRIVDLLTESEEWSKGTVLDLPDGLRWMPSLISVDEETVGHVHLANELRPYIRTRLKPVKEVGKRVALVITLQTLYEQEAVQFLGELDADVVLLSDSGHPGDQRDWLRTLFEENVAVPEDLRKYLMQLALDRLTSGSSYEKGRRLESLLSFLLNRVADLRVRERNYRADTEELDIVLQIDNHSGRCWHKSGAPFILVEAKNWEEKIDQQTVSAFLVKLQTRGGSARIGFLFGRDGFTADAEQQVLKMATREEVIVLLNGTWLAEWAISENLDDLLEDAVRHAMLA
jgi:hypothetical protein